MNHKTKRFSPSLFPSVQFASVRYVHTVVNFMWHAHMAYVYVQRCVPVHVMCREKKLM